MGRVGREKEEGEVKNKTKAKLTIEKIIERLRINDPEVIETVYSLSYNLIKQEADRQANLDGKANNFLGLIGVYVTLVFGLGGLIVTDIKNPVWINIFVPLYLGSLLFSFAALFFSFQSIRTRSDYKSISEEDIFHEQVLEKDESTFKRYLTSHFWEVYRNNFSINELKGAELKKSARMFLFSLGLLLMLIIFLSFYILQKGGM